MTFIWHKVVSRVKSDEMVIDEKEGIKGVTKETLCCLFEAKLELNRKGCRRLERPRPSVPFLFYNLAKQD